MFSADPHACFRPFTGVDRRYPFIRFLEANGFDVTYISGLDVERNASSLLSHRAFVAVGHDEYWSQRQRDAITAARDAGVHLAFFTGNAAYWRVRWEPSPVDGTPHRTMVIYKESQARKRYCVWQWPRVGRRGVLMPDTRISAA